MNKWKKFCLFLVVITTAAAVYLAGKNSLTRTPSTAGSLHLQPLQPQKTRNNAGTLTKTQFKKGVNGSHKGTYVLSIRYSGQQGAGVRGVVSLQCFASNLGIPVYVVEPFINSSKVGLKTLSGDLNRALKFSDFFDLDHFNLASAMVKYVNLITWEEFLNNAPNKTVLVQLKTGDLKQTEVLWTANGSQCYRGNLLSELHLPCVVRVVSICCVRYDRNSKFTPQHDTSMETIYDTVFGNWKPDEVNLLFREWLTRWYVPSSSKLDCKGVYQHYIPERFSPSQQLLEHAKRYRNLFLHSRNITAVMLRFEHMLFKIVKEHSPLTVESCLQEIQDTVKQMNTSNFVAADIGKYGSGAWNWTFRTLKFSSKRASETMKALKHTLSGLVTDIEMWENSFAQATGGIVDRGYIAALQKTLASTADCIIFVGGGNFQNIVLQEYLDNHPNPSQWCIYNICVEERHAQVYQKYILDQRMNLSSIQQEDNF